MWRSRCRPRGCRRSRPGAMGTVPTAGANSTAVAGSSPSCVAGSTPACSRLSLVTARTPKEKRWWLAHRHRCRISGRASPSRSERHARAHLKFLLACLSPPVRIATRRHSQIAQTGSGANRTTKSVLPTISEPSRVSCALPFEGRMARCRASSTRTPRSRRSGWSASIATTKTRSGRRCGPSRRDWG